MSGIAPSQLRDYLLSRGYKHGFLARPCPKCGKKLVIARSGKRCVHCEVERLRTQ